MTAKQFVKLVIFLTIKTSVLTLAALFIADDLGLLKHD